MTDRSDVHDDRIHDYMSRTTKYMSRPIKKRDEDHQIVQQECVGYRMN